MIMKSFDRNETESDRWDKVKATSSLEDLDRDFKKLISIVKGLIVAAMAEQVMNDNLAGAIKNIEESRRGCSIMMKVALLTEGSGRIKRGIERLDYELVKLLRKIQEGGDDGVSEDAG